jgi:gamma-glutamylcyclotransferase (GGCT)/AIG2-like uncharacterized protein YtfP
MGSPSKPSPFALKVKLAPSGWFHQAPKPPRTVDLFSAQPGPYFFYGTLMAPSILAEILGLESSPSLRPAYIMGYERKLWGQYPALLDGAQGSVVHGAVCHVPAVDDAVKLAKYETRNYQPESCMIHYTDGIEPSTELGYVFLFAGHAKDLREGDFNLDTWLRRMGK